MFQQSREVYSGGVGLLVDTTNFIEYNPAVTVCQAKSQKRGG
jgi:hypothetical protein